MRLKYHAQSNSLQNAPPPIHDSHPSRSNSEQGFGEGFLTWLFFFSAVILVFGVVAALSSVLWLFDGDIRL